MLNFSIRKIPALIIAFTITSTTSMAADVAQLWSPVPELASNVMKKDFKEHFSLWLGSRLLNECSKNELAPSSKFDILGYRLGEYCALPLEDRKLIAEQAQTKLVSFKDERLFDILKTGSISFPAKKELNSNETIKFSILLSVTGQSVYLAKIERTIIDEPGHISLQPKASFFSALIKKYGPPSDAITDRNENFGVLQQAKDLNKAKIQNSITNKELTEAMKSSRDIAAWENTLKNMSDEKIVQYVWRTKDSWSDETVLIVDKHGAELKLVLWIDSEAYAKSLPGTLIKNSGDQMNAKILEFSNSRKQPSL